MEALTEYGYRYRALSAADSVRLLTISRADDQPHGMLLSMKETQLDDQPDFAALSYTWKLPEYGNQGNLEEQDCGATTVVNCDGKAMTISENLFNFLSVALHASEANDEASDTKTKLVSKVKGILKNLPLWIDAFCINQNDSEEKRHQVLLMHRIYSAARNVIIWLGPTQPHPDVLWVHDKFIPAISKVTQMKPKFVETHLKNDAMCSSVETIEELGSKLCSRWLSAWLHFAIYINHQCWFDRGWVVQEVALSDPSSVYVCCGKSVLSWKRLAAFAQFLQEKGWSSTLSEQINISTVGGHTRYTEGEITTSPGQVSLRILKISQARKSLAEVARQTGFLMRAESPWDGKLELGWLDCANFLINSLRSSRFSDDRDHIYGCLGMLSMLLPPGCESPILPNYENTVEEAFTAIASLFLTKTPLMTELSRVENRSARRYSKLPSWVPDYSVEIVRQPITNWNFAINQYLNTSFSELRDVETMLWGTNLRRPTRVGPILHHHGVQLDTVVEVSVDKPFEWKSPGMQSLIGESAKRAKLFAKSSNFWTMLALVYEEINALANSVRRSGEHAPSLNNLTPEAVLLLKEVPPITWLHHQPSLRTELLGKHVYSTKGDELGLGPLAVRNADEVWLLEGARTPCILRRVDYDSVNGRQNEEFQGTFIFVGETDLRSFHIRSTHLTSEASRDFHKMIHLV
ncbi:heterokaryon incompatibility protein [Colletotrichum gloeosporioides Cg-14]|uniref:Heterokaryon incompatibility protein n=1 Tax=Colletotrichum gloeosporioides (strain Cg-14) TaxID=1237896 RepID=T0KZS9_COLGC|nr:heterokaryon incompatibility protein [Colletotrichum gloeosporioides Cg-14]